MTKQSEDVVEFDELIALALAQLAVGPAPRPGVKAQLMARIADPALATAGFGVRLAADDDWQPHPVPGIRMKVLSVNKQNGYATLLLDVKPGVRFPAHFHESDEECYVISGSIFTLGRRLGPGDFIHADAGTQHGELWTDEGAQVLLIGPPEDYMASSSI